jgi:hypothetical protein
MTYHYFKTCFGHSHIFMLVELEDNEGRYIWIAGARGVQWVAENQLLN